MERLEILTCVLVMLCLVWGVDAASETTDEHFNRARELLNAGSYEEAAEEFDAVVTLVSADSVVAQNARYWVGQCYFKMGQYDQALSVFEKLAGDHPESAIAPVTQLMVAQVRQEEENEKLREAVNDTASDEGVIIDPQTGVKYTKTWTFVGKRDVAGTGPSNLSPNGKFLLTGKLVVPLDGGDPFDLVDMPASRATWSPDGEKAVFYSEDGICVVPVSPETGHSTGPPRKLLDGKYIYDFSVSWSPDGEKFAVCRRDGEFNVWTISVTDGSPTQITNTPDHDLAPAWSPDGKTIAYGRAGKNRKHSLWFSSVDGQTAQKIVDTERRCVPIWSPDGKWILLDEVFRFIRLADKKEYALTTPEGLGFGCWSPDGKKMLFGRSSHDYRVALKLVSVSGGPTLELGRHLTLWSYTYFWSPDSKMVITEGEHKAGNDVFWMIPLAGGEPFPLEIDVPVAGEIEPSSLSPDGSKLLFNVKQKDGTKDFWVVPISLKDATATDQPVTVFRGQTAGRAQQFSPDGTKLSIVHEGDIWIASAEGSKPVQITNTPEQEVGPMWSPDMEMIAYMRYYSAGKRVLQVTPASGGKEILRLEAFHAFAWSPDGKELAVAFKNNQLSVISIASGKKRQIADLKDINLTEVYDLKWSPDGRNIACVGYHTEKRQSGPIFIIPVEGGKAIEVATDDEGWKGSLYWSPDSKWIAYNSDGMVKTRSEGSIWEADASELLSAIQKEQ